MPTDIPARRRRLSPTAEGERERFCLDDAEVLSLADYAIKVEDHYSAQGRPSDAHGHRMGKGRRGRPTLYRPGAARDRCLASARRRRSRPIALKGTGPSARHRSRGRREDRRRAVRVVADVHDLAAFRPGESSGRRHDEPGLGAGDEDRRRHRHQSRRPHLSCRHRRARARRAGRRRRRGRDGGAPVESHGDRFLRRRRDRRVYDGQDSVRIDAHRR